MFAIIGLGNPDKIYEKTYHNIGFMAIDYFAKKNNLVFTKTKYNGKIAEGIINDEKIILLKPMTYMNLSGNSVSALVRQLKVPLTNICVIYDDIDLNVGTLRFRQSGSAGTHNGMRNIVELLGDTNFPRLRVGIGKPERILLMDYVLSKVSKDKEIVFEKVFEKVSDVLNEFIGKKGNIEAKSILVEND